MSVRVKITKPGIFGAKGEVEVGTELTLKEEPKAWGGRYEVISSGGKDKEAVTGDAGDGKSATEVLAMANDTGVPFMTFKSAATKLLGEKTPASKADIVAALEDLATQP
jgi:hypothetical protein